MGEIHQIQCDETGVVQNHVINRGGSGWVFFSNFKNTRFFLEINLYDDVLAKKIEILGKIHQAPHGFIEGGKTPKIWKCEKI